MSTPLLQLNHYFGIRQQPLHRCIFPRMAIAQ